MRAFSKNLFWLMVLMVSAVPLVMGATITGTVKGPDGKPFEGAFVEAQNMSTTIMTDVLSQEDGSFKVPNLPAGDYRVSIRAVGYKAAAQNETLQTADQHAQCGFDLQKGNVSWSDISVYQAGVLLPNGTGKATWFRTCFGCHNFQSRMATRRLNYQGWMGLINYMRDDAVNYSLGPRGVPFPATNQMADQIASYLTQVFGLNSTLPASPADLPGYQATVQKFSKKAMNIVYVVYPLADSTWLDFQAYPPTVQKGYYADGYIWAADYGNGNRVVRINPKTGNNTTYMSPQALRNSTYPLPCKGEGIHAVEVDPSGNAWYAEQGCNRVGEVNLKAGKVTQFQAPFIDKSEWGIRGGYKHDSHPMLVDGKLYVFSSGDPATRLDPATGKFTSIPGIPNTYDVGGDLVNGNVWFTGISPNTPLYEVDPRTLKTLIRYFPATDPKNFKPHRITFDAKGIVWLTCYNSSRVCRFNPKTKAFKIYTPLGPNKHDYAIAVDHAGNIWYSMTFIDQIQRLDPKTGKIIQYPFPYPEITMRRFWTDAQGRIWGSSPANAVVVNWYLAGGGMHLSK
ncbi:MAG TPA: carboxypeptidase regulatory-like domain-containing protein [Candidatus Dormibacteraeota bacterium]|nr:carboxypeptidase regulatory-like domain-containing protein [Candidatus Dormibacteraeota bacterium]